jgi:hypothetical protein
LKALKHSNILSSEIKEKDEDILKHLIDISYVLDEENPLLKFKVTMTFSSNEFFENEKLTKNFIMKNADEVEETEGCEI